MCETSVCLPRCDAVQCRPGVDPTCVCLFGRVCVWVLGRVLAFVADTIMILVLPCYHACACPARGIASAAGWIPRSINRRRVHICAPKGPTIHDNNSEHSWIEFGAFSDHWLDGSFTHQVLPPSNRSPPKTHPGSMLMRRAATAAAATAATVVRRPASRRPLPLLLQRPLSVQAVVDEHVEVTHTSTSGGGQQQQPQQQRGERGGGGGFQREARALGGAQAVVRNVSVVRGVVVGLRVLFGLRRCRGVDGG